MRSNRITLRAGRSTTAKLCKTITGSESESLLRNICSHKLGRKELSASQEGISSQLQSKQHTCMKMNADLHYMAMAAAKLSTFVFCATTVHWIAMSRSHTYLGKNACVAQDLQANNF